MHDGRLRDDVGLAESRSTVLLRIVLHVGATLDRTGIEGQLPLGIPGGEMEREMIRLADKTVRKIERRERRGAETCAE